MSVSLNEFSQGQLELALNIFIDKIDDLSNKIMLIQAFDDGEVKDDFLKEFNREIDDCLLWKVQIMNAIDELKVQSN